MLVGIQDEILRLHSMGLLKPLLVDKTTRANIIWATDAYRDKGSEYKRNKEIKLSLITGGNADVIKNRARKALEQQSERTRQHAEVFTPFWVCERMLNYEDEAWFGKINNFFKNDMPTEHVIFPKNRTWKQYVDSRRLEITCGEAPYLVSRYDASTGEGILIENRIGILDRKLRVVNENVIDEGEWLEWVIRAFQSTYGYEFQGDNVLIARVNLLMTFEEYLYRRWKRKPTMSEYKTIMNIVVWNIWQMDGLTGTIPYCKVEEEFHQMDLFEWFGNGEYQEKSGEQPHCRIYDWRRGNSLEYVNVNKGGKNMKFNFLIGNPPYQEETTQEMSQSNGQTPKKNIFHYFQMAADQLVDDATILIYPAGRWIHRSGKGMDKFGLQQINDQHLRKVIYYPDSREVFSGVAIADGVGIVIKDMKKKVAGFEYVYCKNGETLSVQMHNPGEELMPLNPKDLSITEKVKQFVEVNDLKYMNERILPRSLFGIESNFIENNPGRAVPLESVDNPDFSRKIKLFTNDKAGKAGRAKWFLVDNDIIQCNRKYINEWQVVVSSANAGGQKRDNQLEIIDNYSAFGRSRVALASFKTKNEASNFWVYAKTYIVRYMFLMTDEALTSLGKRVPDLLDYTNHNHMVDFSRNLDEQLYEIIELTDSEIAHVKDTVNNIRLKEK